MADKLEEIKAKRDEATKLLYPALDAEHLGEWYFVHLNAMTAEGLHLKSSIAAQLAWRDRLLEAAERYIESDVAFDNAVRHAEYLDAVAAREAREKALERWVAAKGET